MMLFGLWIQVGPRNYVLGQGPDSPRGTGNFGGRVQPHCKVQGETTVSCRETAD